MSKSHSPSTETRIFFFLYALKFSATRIECTLEEKKGLGTDKSDKTCKCFENGDSLTPRKHLYVSCCTVFILSCSAEIGNLPENLNSQRSFMMS